jgi:hypothetical protein
MRLRRFLSIQYKTAPRNATHLRLWRASMTRAVGAAGDHRDIERICFSSVYTLAIFHGAESFHKRFVF